jgi:hypothetical protein
MKPVLCREWSMWVSWVLELDRLLREYKQIA